MSEEWIETNGGLASHRNNYDESGKPAGLIGKVMPGDMAACSEHNAKEKWRAEHDQGYVPQYMHPKVVNDAEPSVDTNSDRSGFNGIVKDVPKMQAYPVEQEYKIMGRPDNVEVTDTLAYWIKRAKEKENAGAEPPVAKPAESAVEEPTIESKPVPQEGLVPDTMAGIWKLLGSTRESFYDFGVHTISPAGKKPSLDASLRAYRKNMLLTVARALLLKEYDRRFSAEQVKASVTSSWNGNGRMKKYSEVIRENDSESTRTAMGKILDDAGEFISGKVKVTGKYMNSYVDQKWCIKGFVLWCKKTGQIDFKKTGWRTSKKE